MSFTNPLSPKLLKGTLVKFDTILGVPVPQLIIFQYNPASITRTITIADPTAPAAPGAEAGGRNATVAATAQPQPPKESITLALELDAADSLESPLSHPVAMLAGVADRIAALEMLLYPNKSGQGLLGDLATSLGLGGGLPAPPTRLTVPLTFFVWGPGRILPVRISAFSVEEQEFMTLLYPLRAKVSLTLQVLRDKEYQDGSTTGLSTELANAAWKFYRTQQQVLAVANIANTIESLVNM